ncbi:Polyketide cyclase / dehydrase and lipid transport [Aequorivita sublithincola DSM 14238]|uniref:Polyketide cyclase / dehydrase and lipid transport n=1 Tax=Aequorivita sublithincola (strain DSM 14238 / LMG 21431 / ACAM 643 / 9-3) TaxID=746697 RepID=I3YS84_AEQSU|nr:SRPBCC family protein [Aequorivita sublithincola]AFL79852.1 Polyketide cyclase / dehydrase and lipid transport [Aequorivita sublithincola DSM 14238]
MKPINNSAPVKAEKSIIINSDIDKVWQILTDIDNWSNWNSDISKSKINGEIRKAQTFDWKTGGTKLHSEIHTYNPKNKFGWTGKVLGVYAIHNWNLTETENGTTVLVAESMEGFLAKLFRKSFQKTLENGMTNWLELMKKECEK